MPDLGKRKPSWQLPLSLCSVSVCGWALLLPSVLALQWSLPAYREGCWCCHHPRSPWNKPNWHKEWFVPACLSWNCVVLLYQCQTNILQPGLCHRQPPIIHSHCSDNSDLYRTGAHPVKSCNTECQNFPVPKFSSAHCPLRPGGTGSTGCTQQTPLCGCEGDCPPMASFDSSQKNGVALHSIFGKLSQIDQACAICFVNCWLEQFSSQSTD